MSRLFFTFWNGICPNGRAVRIQAYHQLKKVGRKKYEGTEDKKLVNFVKFYNAVKEARKHGNKATWEVAILEELVEEEENKNCYNLPDVFGEKPCSLPIEPIDIDDWYTD